MHPGNNPFSPPHYCNQGPHHWYHRNSQLTDPCFHSGPLLPLPSRASREAPPTHESQPSLLGSKCHRSGVLCRVSHGPYSSPQHAHSMPVSLPASFHAGHVCASSPLHVSFPSIFVIALSPLPKLCSDVAFPVRPLLLSRQDSLERRRNSHIC